MRQLKITYRITERNNDSLDRYLNELSRLPLISNEEEAILAEKIKNGDDSALKRLVEANLRFVVSVAKQFQNQGLSLPDLINEGNLGLIKAASKFDPSRGFKFISYGVWWIRQSIMQAILNKSKLVRIPVNKTGSISQISTAINNFEQEHHRVPSFDELEEIINVKSSVIKDMLHRRSNHLSFDAPITGADQGFTLYDSTADEKSKKPDDKLESESLTTELTKLIEQLPPREAEIIKCYFGLNGYTRMNLQEIGDRFKLTRERVRQIKDRSIRRLRKSGNSEALKSFLE